MSEMSRETREETREETSRASGSSHQSTSHPTPRPASTLILFASEPIAESDARIEDTAHHSATTSEVKVALLRRSQSVRFLPGALVFPGGSLERDDDVWLRDQYAEKSIAEGSAIISRALSDHLAWGFSDESSAARSLGAALRECSEEAGLGGDRAPLNIRGLSCIGHWLTPEQLKARFDTYFWAAELIGPPPELTVDGGEIERGAWYTPQEAINAYERGEVDLPAPTLCVLAELATLFGEGRSLSEVIQLLNAAAHATPICPVLKREDEIRLYLPGDPCYSATRGDAPRLDSSSFWSVRAHYLERRAQRPTWERHHQ